MVCKAVLVQRAIEEDSGMVPREWPAGTVCAVHPRRQADDQQPCISIPERWHGPCVVSAMRPADLGQVRGETWTGDAFRIEDRARQCQVRSGKITRFSF